MQGNAFFGYNNPLVNYKMDGIDLECDLSEKDLAKTLNGITSAKR